MIDTSSKLSRRSLLAGMVAVPALASAAVAAERQEVKSVQEARPRSKTPEAPSSSFSAPEAAQYPAARG